MKTCRRRKSTKAKKKKNTVFRRGKLNPWVKGAIFAATPSVIATGIGLVKHILRNNKRGYENIYS